MRIRTIKPEFWMHEGLCKCSEFTRLLAIALLNWSDDEGYFMANPVLIRGQLFPFLDESGMIPGSLQDLSRAGWIDLGKDDQGRDVGRVKNFTKHQRVEKPKPSSIKASSVFQEESWTNPGSIQDESRQEGNGMEGNREQGKEPELELQSATPQKVKVWSPTPEQVIINEWFDRRDTTQWSEKEIKAFKAIPHQTILDGIEDMDAYYRSNFQYLRKDVLTLLNNWAGEMDRAAKWEDEKTRPKPQTKSEFA